MKMMTEERVNDGRKVKFLQEFGISNDIQLVSGAERNPSRKLPAAGKMAK